MTDQARTMAGVAPEVKAVPETVTAAFDEFMEAFEAFKEVNDRRLGEIEQKLTADVVTRDKMDRINRSMDEQKKVLDQPGVEEGKAASRLRTRSWRRGAFRRSGGAQGGLRRLCPPRRRGGLRELEAKAFSGGTGTDGGYIVPPETDNEIGRRISVVSPMRALSTVRTVSAAVLKKPFAAAGLSTGWVAETAARPQTNTPQLAELSFPTMELYAMPAATQGLLDDAAVDIEAWIAGEVDIVFAEQEGDAFIRGDGINKPKGFLSYPTVADSAWSLGQYRPYRHRRGGRLEIDRAFGHADRPHLCAEGWPPPERHVHDEPQGAGRYPQVQGCRRQLSLAPARFRRPAGLADGLSDRGSGRDARRGGEFALDRLRRFPLRLPRRRPGGVRILRDPYSAKPYVLFYTTKRVGGGVQNFEAIKLVKFAAA